MASPAGGGLVLERPHGNRLQFAALWLEVAPGSGVEVRHTALPAKPEPHRTHGTRTPRFLGVPAEYLPAILRAVREFAWDGLPLGDATVTIRHGAYGEGTPERCFYDLTQRALAMCLSAAAQRGALIQQPAAGPA